MYFNWIINGKYPIHHQIFEKPLLTFSSITEEESKRLQASYQQIAFNYDGNNPTEQKEEPKEEEPDEAFVQNPKFYIPEDIEIVSSFFLFRRLVATNN